MSVSNVGYGYNAEAFLAHCDFDEQQESQEKFYREEIAPRLDRFENFSDEQIEKIARACDSQWESFEPEHFMYDLTVLVSEVTEMSAE